MSEYTASERLRLRQTAARLQSSEAAIGRQQEIDSTPAALIYQGYDAERQRAIAQTDGGTVYVPVTTNGAIATGASVIGSGGVIDGRPRVVRQEVQEQSSQPSIVAALYLGFQEACDGFFLEGAEFTAPISRPQSTLYLRVNNKTIALLDLDTRIGTDSAYDRAPIYFSIVRSPRPAVIVQALTASADIFYPDGPEGTSYSTYTPVIWHTWVADPASGRLITSHAQITGDRAANQSYAFGDEFYVFPEPQYARVYGWTRSPIEYPAKLRSWQQHLITSKPAIDTFGQVQQNLYEPVVPKSWVPGFSAYSLQRYINPVPDRQFVSRLRCVQTEDATRYEPTLTGLLRASATVAIEAGRAAQWVQVHSDGRLEAMFATVRSRQTLRDRLIENYSVFGRWGFNLDTRLSNLYYPFGQFSPDPATIEQLLDARLGVLLDGFGSSPTVQLGFEHVQVFNVGIVEGRLPFRYFSLINALGVP